MGVVYVTAAVRREGGPAKEVEFLVDSGATYSVLPSRVWRRLVLRPTRSMRFSLADGTTVRRRLSDCRFRPHATTDAPHAGRRRLEEADPRLGVQRGGGGDGDEVGARRTRR